MVVWEHLSLIKNWTHSKAVGQVMATVTVMQPFSPFVGNNQDFLPIHRKYNTMMGDLVELSYYGP